MNIKDTDIAWAAGLFEGEGTFGFSNGVAKRVVIQMTDLDILTRMQDLFGGSVAPVKKRQEHWKDCWIWTLGPEPAYTFTKQILPFLGERRSARALEWLEDRDRQLNALSEKKSQVSETRDKVKELYATGNYTQQKLADMFGVDRTYVAHILRGKYDMVVLA